MLAVLASDISEHVGVDSGEFKSRNISLPESRILWFYFGMSKSRLLHGVWFWPNPVIRKPF
jgi:hypothetical protein